MKKIVFLFGMIVNIIHAQNSYAEKKCELEIKKVKPIVSILEKECLVAAKEYENKKEYPTASWYYMLANKHEYNINVIQKKINKYDNIMNIAHSYVLLGEEEKSKKLYEIFLRNLPVTWADEAMQGDYQLLLKLYPIHKKELNISLAVWNTIYKPLLEINTLYPKYEEAKKAKNYKIAIDYLFQIIRIEEENYLNTNQNKLFLGITYDYDNLAKLYNNIEEYEEALAYYKKALEIRERILGKKHIFTATNYYSIGEVYINRGDYLKALIYYKETLKIKEKVLGKKNRTIAIYYNNIAHLYIVLKDYPKALFYNKEALEIDKKLFGENHASVAIAYNNIGLVYDNMKNYPKALDYYKKSLQINKKIFGEEHNSTVIGYKQLGLFYGDIGNYPQSLIYLQKTLKIYKRVLGEEHMITAISYKNLSVLYARMDDYIKSQKYFKKFLAIKAKCFVEMDNLTTHSNLNQKCNFKKE